MNRKSVFGIAAAVGLATGAIAGTPLSTEFTYQGVLNDGALMADGNYNLQFRLYDASIGGSQVGSTLTLNGYPVADGLVTADLDFGVGAFSGDKRWLQITVDGNTLSPRQPLNAAPYALFAMNAPGGSGQWNLNATGDHVYNNNSGNVGVGISAPAFDLHVRNFVPGGTNQPPAKMGLQWQQAVIGGGPGDWMYFRVGGSGIVPVETVGNHIVRQAGRNLHFTAEPDFNDSIFDYDVQITIDESGDLGVGTHNPNAPLHVQEGEAGVAGHFNSSAIFERSTTNYLSILSPDLTERGLLFGDPESFVNGGIIYNSSPARDGFVFRTGGNFNRMSITDDGNVGIGTTAPVTTLHVATGTDTAPTGGGYIVSGASNGLNISIDNNEIMARNNGNTSTLFLNNNGGAVRVPVLEISGADVAEKFPMSDEAKPGQVVEIDPDNPGQLRLATEAYSTRVAGIVSGANGLPAGTILGHLEGSENQPAIALSGRVWVHCDTSNGAIEPGDRLTTSATAGHAMKATNRDRADGATIGKAMTKLADGSGMVLVLVNLQ